eukprot:CAMPEP_0185593510 /NCGR_PEP_ID=MMETSP0434-20130131/71705_1 /TAXON_ID=626734 ORGANISM="Favella taraikaensis, Strain Fe Narragansett Bay" /NCGR_SAMPLE_ID=MMETSP0434 /ASSEMBLY_ACC=CAM_ASM_000379 /LENGTH=71 /DNA_ID=CAMNT_0028220137 /DNA_START=1327 /DNA_END=1542 /DNA_ORIENTATION=+
MVFDPAETSRQDSGRESQPCKMLIPTPLEVRKTNMATTHYGYGTDLGKIPLPKSSTIPATTMYDEKPSAPA